MNETEEFLLQLAKSIQAWLWVESGLYALYAVLMQGANSHLVSVTFNSIQSVDAKLYLLNSCFTLTFARDSDEIKEWKKLSRKIEKLNKKRNKIVHEPVSILHNNGIETISLGPSLMNAMALVKGQTTHKGSPVVSADYDQDETNLLQDHKINIKDLSSLERAFKTASFDLQAFREKVTPKLNTAQNQVNFSDEKP
ncbi:MAG: hypothetical protein AB2660_15635 [Candidatus Thiodiazotropha sp.]